jgi:DNA-binding Xre family transcriptional regulator
MGRTRLYIRDAAFWDSVRALLEDLHAKGHKWTTIADALGIGKQTLTGFRKGRSPALDAEAVLRICAVWKAPLTFQGHTIRSSADDTQTEALPMLQLQMEFDDSFELRADPIPRAILTRKPPSRVSYIGVRIERVDEKAGPPAA